MLAGAAMVFTGATAAVLAGSHATAAASTSSQCQTLPTPAPAASATPSATSGPDASPSTVPVSSTPKATPPTDLCVTVSAQASSVDSGQDALYSISVTAKGGAADGVTVRLSASSGDSSPAVGNPAFTICGDGDGSQVCRLGHMPNGRVTQMQGKIAVPGSAPSGDSFTLSAKVTGSAGGASDSVTSSATADAVAPTPTKTHTSSPTPTPTRSHHSGSSHHHSGGNSGNGNGNGTGTNDTSGTTGNTDPLAGLPPLDSAGSSPLGSGDPGGLFPTISPSPGATPSTGTTGSSSQHPYKATTVADVLPLNSGQLSAQIAGLVVLCIGVILVFARVSLRKPKGSENKS